MDVDEHRQRNDDPQLTTKLVVSLDRFSKSDECATRLELRMTLKGFEAGLFLAGFLFRGPISLQFGGQLRFRCRTYCLFLGLRSAFSWRRRTTATEVRPPCFLSSRNLLFRSSAHGSLFLWRSSSISRRTEDTAQLLVESLDLLFNSGGSLEFVGCKVKWIHGLVH